MVDLMEQAESLAIHNLIKLLDAESPSVRASVRRELAARGHRLEAFYAHFRDAIPPEMQFAVLELIRRHRRTTPERWPEWMDLDGFYDRIEAALSYLAGFQKEAPDYPPLSAMLDSLAEEVDAEGHEITPSLLCHFLFRSGRLSGMGEDYYNPLYSHLPHVIARGRGLPISLSLIFMLLGARFSLEIQGVNMPGHFLVRAKEGDEIVVFDCFNNGKILSRGELAALSVSPRYRFQALVSQPPSALEIVTRVLNNLLNAYYRTGQIERCATVRQLLRDLRAYNRTEPATTNRTARYACGQIVRHRRYGYRGVVVEIDDVCMADEAWYRANLTQPDRDQPWYHVLVDGSTATTYAAQTSLIEDDDPGEVRHPLVDLYFSSFSDGRYTRNEIPWTLPG